MFGRVGGSSNDLLQFLRVVVEIFKPSLGCLFGEDQTLK